GSIPAASYLDFIECVSGMNVEKSTYCSRQIIGCGPRFDLVLRQVAQRVHVGPELSARHATWNTQSNPCLGSQKIHDKTLWGNRPALRDRLDGNGPGLSPCRAIGTAAFVYPLADATTTPVSD